ncbi:MAG: hypothetical protein Q9M26_04480 [Mariprofundales bacterium]|nr:hypothetical protein [Mariprofundales bacterium]
MIQQRTLLRLTLLSGCALAWSLLPASAQDFIERSANGSINWSSGEVHATGIGVPPERYKKYPARARAMAIRAAKIDALRNLMEQMQGVRVESQTLMKDAAIDSDLVRTTMKGTVRNASMVGKPHYMEDMSVEIEMAVNYRQSIAAPAAKIVTQQLQQEARSQPQAPIESAPNAPITGLIIDAHGLGLRPAIAPKIVTKSGKVIYSALIADSSHDSELVAYDRSLNDAKKLARAGDHPAVIKGSSVQDISDIVISDADAARLDQMGGLNSVLRQARVIIIL